MAAAARCLCALLLALPGAEGTFLFSDKLAGTKTNVLPLGDPALKLSRAFIVTRQTSGVLGGLLGAQHGQLILEPQSREHLWAVDLHTIRDPKRPEVRLDLAELCIVRVPWVDVPSSDFYNAKTVFSAAEQAAKREESPGWAPRGILETYEFEAAALPSERMMLSFTRAFHKHFAYSYNRRTFNCQVFTASMLVWLAGGREMVSLHQWIADSGLIEPPSKEELAALYRTADLREQALDSGQLDTPLEDTTAVDSLDQLSGRDSCGYAQRATSAAVFPPSIDVKSHQLGLASHGDT